MKEFEGGILERTIRILPGVLYTAVMFELIDRQEKEKKEAEDFIKGKQQNSKEIKKN